MRTGCWSSGISPSSAPLRGTPADRETVEKAIAAVRDGDTKAIAEPVGPAIRYALSGGGKRFRGMLVLAAYRASGGPGDASALAAAVEIIHTYSLVHDDLPCMDNDDMRRGRASAHRVFGVAEATVAGAAMIPLAASVAYRAARDLQLPEQRCCTIVKVLMQAAGAGGMIGGQLLDLAGEGTTLSKEALDAVHASKTGALIAAAVKLGGLAAGASDTRLGALERFGSRAGLAFQIMDDVLDVTASSDQLGKTAGRDAKLGKSTYPALLGVEGAVARARALVSDGCDDLLGAGLLTADLEGLADFIVSRGH